MRSTVIVAQPYIPEYRVAFFRRLSERLKQSGYDLEVFVSSTTSPNGDAATSIPTARAGGLASKRLLFRSGLLRRALADDVALVVAEQASKNADFLPLLLMRRKGYRVCVWGHGGAYLGQRNALAARSRLWMAQSADAVFVYTRGGSEYLTRRGVPEHRITVLNNTLDTDTLRRELNAVTSQDLEMFRSRLGLTPGKTALYIGRLDRNKGVEFLLNAVPYAVGVLPDFALVMGGVGNLRSKVESGQGQGLPIRYLGRLDGARKALALRAADAMAIPSWIGLVAVDSLVAGVPIVTRDNNSHAPESEYLNRTTQSLWLPSSASPKLFGEALANLLSSPELIHMQTACRAEADQHQLDEMVEAFHNGLMRCLHE